MASSKQDGSDLLHHLINQELHNFEDLQSSNFQSYENTNHNMSLTGMAPVASTHENQYGLEGPNFFQQTNELMTTQSSYRNANVLDFSNQLPQSFPNLSPLPPTDTKQGNQDSFSGGSSQCDGAIKFSEGQSYNQFSDAIKNFQTIMDTSNGNNINNKSLMQDQIVTSTYQATSFSPNVVEAMQQSLQAFMSPSIQHNLTMDFKNTQNIRLEQRNQNCNYLFASSNWGSQYDNNYMMQPQNLLLNTSVHQYDQGLEMLTNNLDSQSQSTLHPICSPEYVNTRDPKLTYGNLNIQNRSEQSLVGAENNFGNSRSHETSMHPTQLYGNHDIHNRSQQSLVGAGYNSINSRHHAISMHPTLLCDIKNTQNKVSCQQGVNAILGNFQQQSQIFPGPTVSNSQPQSAIMHVPTMTNLQQHSPTMHGPTMTNLLQQNPKFNIPSAKELSPSTRKLPSGTIQRITITPAPSTHATQQNIKGVVINQNIDNTTKQGENQKEPEPKRRGPGRPPKRQGYDLTNIPKGEKEKEPEPKRRGPGRPPKRQGYDFANISKVQKAETSSPRLGKIGSGKVESSVTLQKDQMTSENVDKEVQIVNKAGSHVESRREYQNAIYHKNSDWPLDIHLKKFKYPSDK